MNSMKNSSKPSRVTSKLKHSIFSNYTAALSHSATDSIDNKYTYPALSQKQPVSIYFSTSNTYLIDFTSPLSKA